MKYAFKEFNYEKNSTYTASIAIYQLLCLL